MSLLNILAKELVSSLSKIDVEKLLKDAFENNVKSEVDVILLLRPGFEDFSDKHNSNLLSMIDKKTVDLWDAETLSYLLPEPLKTNGINDQWAAYVSASKSNKSNDHGEIIFKNMDELVKFLSGLLTAKK